MGFLQTTPVACVVCGAKTQENLCQTRTRLIPELTTSISLCTHCGFVFVSPRWSKKDYDLIQDKWFAQSFVKHKPKETDPDKKFHKWQKMAERVRSFLPKEIGNLLDIGAGPGWSIEYWQKIFPNLQGFAIERWPECIEHMREAYGAEIIGTDVHSEWDKKYENSFDLIILRHTLEHLLEPREVLKKIRSYLADTGLVYLVVPSLREINSKTLLHNYFRPVHLSYFCRESLTALCATEGLEPVVIKEAGEGELWGLFKKAPIKIQKPDLYPEMKDYLGNYLSRENFTAKKMVWGINALRVLNWLNLDSEQKPWFLRRAARRWIRAQKTRQ